MHKCVQSNIICFVSRFFCFIVVFYYFVDLFCFSSPTRGFEAIASPCIPIRPHRHRRPPLCLQEVVKVLALWDTCSRLRLAQSIAHRNSEPQASKQKISVYFLINIIKCYLNIWSLNLHLVCHRRRVGRSLAAPAYLLHPALWEKAPPCLCNKKLARKAKHSCTSGVYVFHAMSFWIAARF